MCWRSGEHVVHSWTFIKCREPHVCDLRNGRQRSERPQKTKSHKLWWEVNLFRSDQPACYDGSKGDEESQNQWCVHKWQTTCESRFPLADKNAGPYSPPPGGNIGTNSFSALESYYVDKQTVFLANNIRTHISARFASFLSFRQPTNRKTRMARSTVGCAGGSAIEDFSGNTKL